MNRRLARACSLSVRISRCAGYYTPDTSRSAVALSGPRALLAAVRAPRQARFRPGRRPAASHRGPCTGRLAAPGSPFHAAGGPPLADTAFWKQSLKTTLEGLGVTEAGLS